MTKTSDGKTFDPTEARLVGSVTKRADRTINKPAKLGEFPVFVEQHGAYRLFTYSKKLVEI